MHAQPPGETPSPSDTQAGASPLATANPSSLDELFSRDPLDLGDADLDRIVGELRKSRELWRKAEAEGKTRAPRPKADASGPKAGPDQLSLEELGL